MALARVVLRDGDEERERERARDGRERTMEMTERSWIRHLLSVTTVSLSFFLSLFHSLNIISNSSI